MAVTRQDTMVDNSAPIRTADIGWQASRPVVHGWGTFPVSTGETPVPPRDPRGDTRPETRTYHIRILDPESAYWIEGPNPNHFQPVEYSEVKIEVTGRLAEIPDVENYIRHVMHTLASANLRLPPYQSRAAQALADAIAPPCTPYRSTITGPID